MSRFERGISWLNKEDVMQNNHPANAKIANAAPLLFLRAYHAKEAIVKIRFSLSLSGLPQNANSRKAHCHFSQ